MQNINNKALTKISSRDFIVKWNENQQYQLLLCIVEFFYILTMQFDENALNRSALLRHTFRNWELRGTNTDICRTHSHSLPFILFVCV